MTAYLGAHHLADEAALAALHQGDVTPHQLGVEDVAAAAAGLGGGYSIIIPDIVLPGWAPGGSRCGCGSRPGRTPRGWPEDEKAIHFIHLDLISLTLYV